MDYPEIKYCEWYISPFFCYDFVFVFQIAHLIVNCRLTIATT